MQVLSDGSLLTGGWERSCRWDLETGALIRRYEGKPTTAVNWMTLASPDERRIVAGYGNLTLAFYDAKDGHVIAEHETDGIITSVSIDAAGKRALTGQPQKKIRLWDLETGAPLATLKAPRSYCWKVALSNDGALAVSASGSDKLVHVWDLREEKELAPLEGHTKAIDVLVFAPDGQTLASGSNDGTVRLWTCTASERAPLATLSGHKKAITGVAFAPDGARVASSSADGTVRIASLANSETLEILGADEPLTCVTFARDGRVIAGGKQVHVWDSST